jgi:hypothetical protein
MGNGKTNIFSRSRGFFKWNDGEGRKKPTPLGGGVQSVTGPSVDNTDPANPVIPEIPVITPVVVYKNTSFPGASGGVGITQYTKNIGGIEENGTYFVTGYVILNLQGSAPADDFYYVRLEDNVDYTLAYQNTKKLNLSDYGTGSGCTMEFAGYVTITDWENQNPILTIGTVTNVPTFYITSGLVNHIKIN